MRKEREIRFLETLAKGGTWGEAVTNYWFDHGVMGVEKWVEGQKVMACGLAAEGEGIRYFKGMDLDLYDARYHIYTRHEPTDEQHDAAGFLKVIDALLHDHERLKMDATHDPLTGALNRKGLQEWFEERTKKFADVGFTLVLFDLDGFKQLNDTQGHARGDEALVAITNDLRAQLRAHDIISRIGGDEFVFILESSACHPGIRDRLEVIRDHLPLKEYGIGVTMGAACYPQHGQNLPQLLALADALMYRGKHAGKGQVVLWEVLHRDETAC